MNEIELEDWQKGSDGKPLPEGTIPLRDGTKDGGVSFKIITMRPPTVKDDLVVDAMQASDAVKEVRLMANLCELSPEAIEGLSKRDYRRLLKVYQDFLA